MKFDVLNRVSGNVQFTAEIDCAESAAISVKLGLAVNWAIKNSADLSSADLSFANLSSASLSSANLSSADLLVLQGFGSRASTLYAYKTQDGEIQIRTGCFFGTIKQFLDKRKKTHEDNLHGKDYALIGKLIKQHFKVGLTND